MVRRCYDPRRKAYKHYGGRGIFVCREWKTSFESFREWAISSGWKKGSELDRIDNDGIYEPKNCRFVSRRINVLNRRIQSNNTSGFEGVYYSKRNKKWTPSITYNGSKHSFGYYSSAIEAAKVRDAVLLCKGWDLEGYKLSVLTSEDKEFSNKIVSSLPKEGLRQDNTSGYKGVSWHKQSQRWRARVFINGKERSLGYFQRKEDAAEKIRQTISNGSVTGY